MRSELLTILRCPTCGDHLTGASAENGALSCSRCGRKVPLVAGIPRFVDVLDDPAARRTQASFGYEWTHFNDWRESGETNFNDYFDGVNLTSLRNGVVLDAGCGMGRHARQIAPHAGRVVAVDFSRAIDQAALNTAEAGNVDCVQADLLALPLADESFDFVYSLGVLHHLRDTAAAITGLAAKVRHGGRMRIYVYWAQTGWRRSLLKVVTAIRRVTTRLPFPLLKTLCWILSVVLFAAVIAPYRLLQRLGITLDPSLPLVVYTKYPFRVLYNDQFDRFSAPLEKRYTDAEARRLLEDAGLVDVRVFPRFGWIVEGRKP